MELEGKRVVVTGAGQGLGRAYAEEIAREGASVLVNDVDPANCTDVVAGDSKRRRNGRGIHRLGVRLG